MPADDTREMHLLWCRTRALEYLGLAQLQQAYSSMVSDLTKHPETHPNKHQREEGLRLVVAGDRAGVRDWIEDFR